MQTTCAFSSTEIQNVKQFEYLGKGESVLAKVFLNRYWNWLANFVPDTFPPNSITFIGFLIEFIAFIVSFSLSDSFRSPIPNCLKIFSGLLLFIYQTLDNIDGIHSRRLNNSTSIGYFFDHGIGAVNGIFIIIQMIVSLNLGNTNKSFILIYLAGIYILLTCFQEYTTHSFYLGYINLHNEGLFLLSILLIFTGIFPDLFDKSDIIFYAYIIVLTISIVQILCYIVYKSISNLEIRNRALFGSIPILISALLIAIMSISNSDSFSQNTLVMIYCGFLFSYQSQIVII